MGFGSRIQVKDKKQEVVKKPVEKVEIKGSVKSSALKDKISKFGKSPKVKSFNNFGKSFDSIFIN